MNILPHKDWHVWRRENIAKVEEDERKHKEKEDSARRRRREIEQELRLVELRRKQGLKSQSENDNGETKHINLFEDWERKIQTGNPDVAKAKKDEELRTRAQFNAHLGEGASETMRAKPWWFEPSTKPPDSERKAARKKADRTLIDPLTTLHSVLPADEFLPGDDDSQIVKKRKKRKKPMSIEELRRERLAREAEEQRRVRSESEHHVERLVERRDGGKYHMQYAKWVGAADSRRR